MKNNTIKEIATELNKAEKIVIFPHILMDGDALGSSVALCVGLRKKGKEACIAIEDKIPDYLTFLDKGYCIGDFEKIDTPDVSVCVDCGDYSRFRKRKKLFDCGKTKVCIDHHPTSEGIGDFNYIDGGAAATGEIIFDLLKEMNVVIDGEISNAIFAAITTDTGNFQYSNTTRRSHEIVSELYDFGLDAYSVSVNLYESESINKIKLHALVMKKAEMFAEGKGIIVSITQEMLEESNALMEDTEGIVSTMRSIKGVEMAIVLKEAEKENIKVSMRSKGDINVADISVKYGGGGHAKAAGCTLRQSIGTAKEEILKAAEEELCRVF